MMQISISDKNQCIPVQFELNNGKLLDRSYDFSKLSKYKAVDLFQMINIAIMLKKLQNRFTKPFPQNFLLKKPLAGAVVVTLFNFVFVMIYRPAQTHPGYFLSYEMTMAVYCAGVGLAAFLVINLMKMARYFSNPEEWNFIKELISVIIVIFAMGMAVYFVAFLIEKPADRWNLETLADSYIGTLLIAGIPLYLFTAININQLFQTKLTHPRKDPELEAEKGVVDERITINTPLKKEEMSFYPSEFLYAESDGNYVKFYLQRESEIREKVIRCSISSVEDQLSDIPFLLKTHRAFIVNLKKVEEANGNALGFRLKIPKIPGEIPVSRRHTGKFRDLFKQFG